MDGFEAPSIHQMVQDPTYNQSLLRAQLDVHPSARLTLVASLYVLPAFVEEVNKPSKQFKSRANVALRNYLR